MKPDYFWIFIRFMNIKYHKIYTVNNDKYIFTNEILKYEIPFKKCVHTYIYVHL